MCIIITKEHSAAPLPEEIFDIIWTNNPDGGGILYNNGKKTILKKGLMNKNDFIKAAKEVNKKGYSYIMHTRIATHGSIKAENTHPFVSKYLGFAHNGTFAVEPFPDKTASATSNAMTDPRLCPINTTFSARAAAAEIAPLTIPRISPCLGFCI